MGKLRETKLAWICESTANGRTHISEGIKYIVASKQLE